MGEQGPGTQSGKRSNHSHNALTIIGRAAKGKRHRARRGKFPSPQTAANQAAIACALERYRLANGQYPETLQALRPQFMDRLSNDVITGQPYKYRRTDDSQFILYSVGWNEKDDGGVPSQHGLFDDQEGDWVWAYPGK
jgi:hypothetical protein